MNNTTDRKPGRSIAFYPLRAHLTSRSSLLQPYRGTGTRTNSRAMPRPLHSPSRQLKIKRDRRNRLHSSAIDRCRICAPSLYRINRCISQHRLALQNLLYFDAPVRFYLHLQFHDSMNACALSEFGIGWVRRSDEPLEEIAGVLPQSAQKGNLELVHPAFEPVARFSGGWNFIGPWSRPRRLNRKNVRVVLTVDPLALLANERI